MKRFGTDYGGFYYPENLNGLDKNSIIYCIGAGEDISHDIEIANKLKSKIYIFDPTPRSIEHVNYVKDVFDNKKKHIDNKRFGGGDPNYWNILINNKIDTSNIIFIPYGLYTKNDTLKFYKPYNNDYVSHSLVNGIKSEDYIMVPVKTLTTFMNELNHTKIDLLKIDIEGCECDILNQMIVNKIFPKYLSVDFDLARTNNTNNLNYCINTVNMLLNNGYSIINNKDWDISFELKNL